MCEQLLQSCFTPVSNKKKCPGSTNAMVTAESSLTFAQVFSEERYPVLYKGYSMGNFVYSLIVLDCTLMEATIKHHTLY